MPARRDGIPIIVRSHDQAERLERLPLQSRQIDEGWLQNQLHNCPQLLPIDEIDPSFGPLIAIGREIGTPVGAIDNLYVSPQGLLTIVEAKLWKNPQARREVVGQILDYAKEVSRWSYDDLDARAKEATGRSLWELVAATGTIDEARFIDAVSRNLRGGRFLLLIIGDGIREEMENLTQYLQDSPQLRFTLALVELQIFRLAADLLVIPSVVARTIEITRAVVEVISSTDTRVVVSLPQDGKRDAPSEQRRRLDSEEFFVELGKSLEPGALNVARRLHDDFLQDSRFEIDWGKGSYQVKLRDPADPSIRFTMIVVTRFGSAYVGWLTNQLRRAGLPPDLGKQYFADSARLVGRTLTPEHGEWDKPVSLTVIAKCYGDLKALIEGFAERVSALRQLESQKVDLP